MTIQDFSQIRWELHPQNPLIHPPRFSAVIADPSVVTPDNSPDGQWHLFAHSLWNLLHYTSSDGIHWSKPIPVISSALRPNIYKEEDTFYLYFEKFDRLRLAISFITRKEWYSDIQLMTSKDLIHWSSPQTILKPSMSYAIEPNGGKAVSNPCLLKTSNGYRLYFSAGLVHVPDCGFNEPRYIAVAECNSPLGPFTPSTQPIISPEKDDVWNNLGAGSIKVLNTEEGCIGFQNGIYLRNGISGSAIRLWHSQDGLAWKPVTSEPLLQPQGNDWMASHIYACDIRYFQQEWYLYFNARTTAHWTKGKESIGLLKGTMI